MLNARLAFMIVIMTISLAGCLGTSNENIRPTIAELPDETLTVGDVVQRTVKIENAILDVIDVEIISDDTSVATVVVDSVYNEDDLPSITVSATRDAAFNATSAFSTDVGTEIETTFTITAVAAGETRFTIYATNDPMNDEADAIPVTFRVTVKEALPE